MVAGAFLVELKEITKVGLAYGSLITIVLSKIKTRHPLYSGCYHTPELKWNFYKGVTQGNAHQANVEIHVFEIKTFVWGLYY